MTFWGVEVKPGKPFTVTSDELGGKLILTQATLGTGPSSKKSILQVNVGDNDPVFLCTLLPEKSESCSLNLEFYEDHDVKFSVVGPTSIHISGFLHEGEMDEDDSDSDFDSYGEDAGGCDVAGCEDSDCESEDDYDDDSVDEDDMAMYQPSPVPNSGVVIEEIEDDEKPTRENGGGKQAKNKKPQQQIVVKGNSGTSVLESEDEDGFPVSSSHKGESSVENPKENTASKYKKKKDAAKDDNDSAKSLKRKVDAVDDDEPKSDAIDAVNGDKKKKKKKKKAKTADDEAVANVKPNADKAANVKQDAAKEDKKMSKADEGAKQSKDKSTKRTFPNGLVIEELKMGKPNGKRASRGKKVSVHYIGKLLKNGKQFDASIGKSPFKFSLGCGQVIKGWDVGVEGMRVGDKRRLTIPPSMGYGTAGAPPQIPPNAWLTFDVELVGA